MTTTVTQAPAAPPEERFWTRYSPRGEMPLSVSGSLAVHVLVGGALLLAAVYLAAYLTRADHPVPIELARMIEPGRKPGHPAGKPGAAKPEEDVGRDNGGDAKGEYDVQSPKLSAPERTRLEQQFDEPSRKILEGLDTEAARRWGRLDDKLRDSLSRAARVGPPPRPGSKPGAGGKGGGGGKLELTPREKRMLRWHMTFTANTGPQYLEQMRSLGAILAFPVQEGDEPKYKVVRDLRPGGKLLDEDVTKLERIYWIDDKPRSVKDIAAALGLRFAKAPRRFVAFMPKKLEDELFAMEKRHVETVLKEQFDEARVEETRFKVVKTPTGYKAELTSVRTRRD